MTAMRESNTPPPPVLQSAAITSSRRNNLLRAQQTLERTPHGVYPVAADKPDPLVDGGAPPLGCGEISPGGGCRAAATAARPHGSRRYPAPRQEALGASERPAGPAPCLRRPGKEATRQTPTLRRSATPTEAPGTPIPGQRDPAPPEVLDRCAYPPARPPSSPPHPSPPPLEWVPVNNYLWPRRALRLRLWALPSPYRDSGVPVTSCRRLGRRHPRC
jgi:hypothetical protein